MSQETIVAIVIAIIGSGGSGVFVTWILSKVDQRHDPLHEGGNGTGTSMSQDIRDAHIANTD